MVNESLVNFNQSVQTLQEIGFFNYLLPMGIFFLILYGILDQYNIVTKDKKINAVLALFISTFVVLYAYLNNVELFFSEFYMKMSIAILIFLFALTLSTFIFRGLRNNNVIKAENEKLWGALLLVASVLVINMSLATAPGPIGTWASEVSMMVFLFGVIGAVASFFIKGESSGGGGE